MGILNVTEDSFSDGGELYRHGGLHLDRLLKRAEQMIAEGAAILDVGGESTRPGAKPVSEEEELDRVLPALEALQQRFDVPISVDTSNPTLMREAAAGGADMLNDVRALTRPGALEAAASTQLPICLMHMQGEPGSMQNNPRYESVVVEVLSYLRERVSACEAAGIARERLLIDPGFGFGKRLQDNWQLVAELKRFCELGLPLLIGVSRKSMVGALLNKPAAERDVASAALAMLCCQQGAQIVRTHNVAATVDALTMWWVARDPAQLNLKTK